MDGFVTALVLVLILSVAIPYLANTAFNLFLSGRPILGTAVAACIVWSLIEFVTFFRGA